MAFTAKLKATLKSKGGTVINAGETVTVSAIDGQTRKFRVTGPNGEVINVYFAYAHKYFSQFRKPPTMAQLERYSMDSIVPSVTGARVEPDGYDSHGFPSWLLVAGLI